MKYTITPKTGKPFDLEADDAIAAMVVATERLGHDRYSIRRLDAMPAPLFGMVMPDGRIQL